MNFVEATVKPGRKSLNDGAVVEDRKLPEVPVIVVDGDPVSPSEEKPQVRQVLASRYPAYPEGSLLALLNKSRASTYSPVIRRKKLIRTWQL